MTTGMDLLVMPKKEEIARIIKKNNDVVDSWCFKEIINECKFKFEKEEGRWYATTWKEVDGPYKTKRDAIEAFLISLRKFVQFEEDIDIGHELNREHYNDPEIHRVFCDYYSKTDVDHNCNYKYKMFKLWIEGQTYGAIAKKFNITREMARQHICKCAWRYDWVKDCLIPEIKSGERNPETYQSDTIANIRFLGIPWKLFNILARNEIWDLHDLSKWTEAEFLSIRNVGPATLNKLKPHMEKYGINFKEEN